MNRGKDPDKALDALIAEIWYKQMNSENGPVQQETKDASKESQSEHLPNTASLEASFAAEAVLGSVGWAP